MRLLLPWRSVAAPGWWSRPGPDGVSLTHLGLLDGERPPGPPTLALLWGHPLEGHKPTAGPRTGDKLAGRCRKMALVLGPSRPLSSGLGDLGHTNY